MLSVLPGNTSISIHRWYCFYAIIIRLLRNNPIVGKHIGLSLSVLSYSKSHVVIGHLCSSVFETQEQLKPLRWCMWCRHFWTKTLVNISVAEPSGIPRHTIFFQIYNAWLTYKESSTFSLGTKCNHVLLFSENNTPPKSNMLYGQILTHHRKKK